MNNLFRYESDLVRTFQDIHFSRKQTLLISEMKIRWGNIDLVEISNNVLPFTAEQCKVLSGPSCAKIFMRLKNKRLLSKQKLFQGLGISESTFQRSLQQLQKAELIIRENQNYRRCVEFTFPKVMITGYEAKLTDYNKALFQARMNREYVDYSYMVFPMDIAEKIVEKYAESIEKLNLGLIGVSENRSKEYIKPRKCVQMKPYVRLMNLVLANDEFRTNEATV